MKMLIFRICLLLSIRKAESSGCIFKYGFGLDDGWVSKPVDTQPSATVDLVGCKTMCDQMV